MARPEFSLYFHPTTTVYIDDNKDFLSALTLKSEPGSFKTFSDPHEGLSYIEAQTKLVEDFGRGEPVSPDINTPYKLVLPQNHICQKLNSLNRFAEPSILVIDYSMPHLNGLELCAQLSNPNTKKILLTGVANEKQAISALNSELIDFYIDKNEHDLSGRLNTIIGTINKRYFNDLLPMSTHDAKFQIPFLFDSDFADFFEQTCEDLNIVEYYYVTNPGGFLMIDRQGVMSRIIVQTARDLQESIEEVRQRGANQECLDTLESGKYIPFFQNHDGQFEANYLAHWKEHIYPIQVIEGNSEISCAIIKKKFHSLTCYKDYLDMPSNRFH